MVTLDGAPWFVAADVCKLLEFKAHPGGGYAHHLTYHLDDDDRRTINRNSLGMVGDLFPSGRGSARISLITEAGLYDLVTASKKPEAQEFKRWVTHTVLPSIRKDGGYVLGEEKVATGELSEDELVLKVMQMQAAKVERLKAERDAALKAQAPELPDRASQDA